MLLHHSSHDSSRRGVVLLAVLVVVVLLSLAAYKYNDHMVAEYRAADSAVRAAQARASAESGVHYAAALLALGMDTTLNGNPWNNPTAFQGISIPSSAKNASPGRFTILSLLSPDDLAQAGGSLPYRFGVTDESGKINLNALLALDGGQGNIAQTILMQLPNMTQDIANAILDWLDPDETPRQNGAESDYYSSLNPPYQCKNGPLDSIEELLLVKGVTPQLLFGNDRNRNGVLDPDEDDGTGQVDLGWSAYLTVYSREPNVDSNNNGRIYLNDQDVNSLLQKLTTALGDDLANYIIAYRMYGGSPISGSTKGPATPTSAGDRQTARTAIQGSLGGGQSKGKLNNIQSMWDLVNSTVSIRTGSGRSVKTVSYASPLNDPNQQQKLLPLLLDSCTVKQDSDLAPRINVNTAPQTILTALSTVVTDLKDADVQAILSNRPSPTDSTAPDPIFKTAAWLVTKANITPATLKKLDPYITARTQVYRVQSIGYSDDGAAMARVEAIIDTNQGRPRIVYLRDLTELGRAFDRSAIAGGN
jgi:type II secretory pathway component PulK